MRIAFLTHQFPGARMGGLGSYTVAAAGALAEAGHEAHIFTFDLPAEARRLFEAQWGGRVVLHSVPGLAGRVASGAVAAEAAAAVQAGGEAVYRLSLGVLLCEAVMAAHGATPFDVVEAPEYEALALPLMLQRGAAGGSAPAVVTQLHSGSAVGRYGNGLVEATGDAAIDALEAAAVLLADGVVAMTEAVVRETRRALGVEREVEIVPMAVRVEEHYVPPASTGPVLFVGRLEKLKGADVLARAAGRFLSRCPDARLRFVGPDTPTAPEEMGDRSMRAWMVEQVPAEVRGRAEFTGELGPAEVAAEVRGARFLVLPSVVENFSQVAAQGMGMGRTCIFTQGIGTSEVYGETGVAVAAGDAEGLASAMERLWVDAGKVAALSAAAYERARGAFGKEKIVGQRIAFYERVVREAGRSRRDLAQLPGRLAGAILEPLARMTEVACGVQGAEAGRSAGERLLRIMKRIAKETGQANVRVLLYGAGRHSARLMTEKHLWSSAGHEVVGFVDDGKRWEQEGTHLGLPVWSRDALTEKVVLGEEIPAIVLSTDTFERQFWEQTAELRERGVRVFRLYGE